MRRADSLKRPWYWQRLKAGGEGDYRGWDGWMASPIWWTWVWVSSRSWWWIGKPACAAHGVAKSQTQLSDRTKLNCEICTSSTVPGIFRLITKNKTAIYSHQSCTRAPVFFSSLPALGVSKLTRFCQSVGVKWNLTRVLLFISLIISNVEHLS